MLFSVIVIGSEMPLCLAEIRNWKDLTSVSVSDVSASHNGKLGETLLK